MSAEDGREKRGWGCPGFCGLLFLGLVSLPVMVLLVDEAFLYHHHFREKSLITNCANNLR